MNGNSATEWILYQFLCYVLYVSFYIILAAKLEAIVISILISSLSSSPEEHEVWAG
jgi:hypothetical protein